MTDHEDNVILVNNVLDHNSQNQQIVDLFRTNLFQTFNCRFVPTVCYFVDCFSLLSEISSFKYLWQINYLVGFSLSEARYILPWPRLWRRFFHQKSRIFFFWLDRMSRINFNSPTVGQRIEVSAKFYKNLNFHQQSQPPCHVMQKEIVSLEIVEGVNFEFNDSLKTTILSNCYFFTVLVKIFAIGKLLVILKLLEHLAEWILFKMSTICSIKVN